MLSELVRELARDNKLQRVEKRAFEVVRMALYPAILLAGAALAISGVVVGTQRYNQAVAESGSNWFQGDGWYVASHAGTGIVLFLLTLTYAVVHGRWGNRRIAPLIYLLNYGICGVAFEAVLVSAGKGENLREDLGSLIVGSVLFLIPALVVTGFLIRSTRPNFKL